MPERCQHSRKVIKVVNRKILALTSEGRELEIIQFVEPRCLAYKFSGNPYPYIQSEAIEDGLKIQKRDLYYLIQGVGYKCKWTDVEEMYEKYMRDPIVWVLTETGEYNYPDTGRVIEPPPAYP